jgi:hypothetical protein
MAILEVGDDGVLHVPASLLGGAKPHTQFQLDTVGDMAVLRPASEREPYWKRATPAERAETFLRWAAAPRPPAPDLPPEAFRREQIYD